MSRSLRCSILLLALFSSVAWSAPPTLAFRGGWAMEAAQGNLKDGWSAGASAEWPMSWGVAGLDADWAEDGQATPPGVDYSFRVIHLGPFARMSFGQGTVRPHLEAGAGAAYMRWEARTSSGFHDQTSRVGPAAWFGAGVSARLDPHWDARLEGRYQAYVISLPDLMESGGDYGDHVGITLGFAFHR